MSVKNDVPRLLGGVRGPLQQDAGEPHGRTSPETSTGSCPVEAISQGGGSGGPHHLALLYSSEDLSVRLERLRAAAKRTAARGQTCATMRAPLSRDRCASVPGTVSPALLLHGHAERRCLLRTRTVRPRSECRPGGGTVCCRRLWRFRGRLARRRTRAGRASGHRGGVGATEVAEIGGGAGGRRGFRPRRCPAIGGRRSSWCSRPSGTNLALSPAPREQGSCPGTDRAARKTRSTVCRPDRGPGFPGRTRSWLARRRARPPRVSPAGRMRPCSHLDAVSPRAEPSRRRPRGPGGPGEPPVRGRRRPSSARRALQAGP